MQFPRAHVPGQCTPAAATVIPSHPLPDDGKDEFAQEGDRGIARQQAQEQGQRRAVRPEPTVSEQQRLDQPVRKSAGVMPAMVLEVEMG